MGQRKKILFLITEDWYFCSHRLQLAKAASVAGYSIYVATRLSKFRNKIEQEGFSIIPLNMKRNSKNIIREIQSISELVKIYRREKPDLVHQVGMKPVLYGSIAAKFTRVPNVINALAGLGFVFSSNKILAKLLRPWFVIAFRYLLNDKSYKTIVQNPDDEYYLKNYIGISEQNIIMIKGSGVDIDYFKPHPEPQSRPVVITLVSRMLIDKGVTEFVEAIKLLNNERISVRGVLVGDPDDENPTSIPRSQLLSWNEDKIVEWWGEQDDISDVWRKSHIAILPSYREGLPKSLLEAAACGRPIIATDVPGCREIVRNGENGFLVPVKNPQQIAKAIKILINDEKLRNKMGIRSRQIVEAEFSTNKIVTETLSLYRQLL